jgi:squalene cyclase
METTQYPQNYGKFPGFLYCSPIVSNILLPLNRALPNWLPFHPHRWWIHVRNVYIPMSYLYGVRFKFEENDLILSLREVKFGAKFLMLCDTENFTGTLR